MTFYSTLLCLLAIAFSYLHARNHTASIHALDETYGFRGARFKTDTSAYHDLALAEKAGQTRYYRRTSDSPQLGSGQVAAIPYGFYQGKLAIVMLETSGLTNSCAVLVALEQQAGVAYFPPAAYSHLKKAAQTAKQTDIPIRCTYNFF
ncbi:hypothetical protein [Hymenobacter sp.]|jgi:hypothetical protein|uniref:hypothetical protein n=1 Tax=Hymenobacter sp. TaxID=1898978 RepID=UPI002ED8F912